MHKISYNKNSIKDDFIGFLEGTGKIDLLKAAGTIVIKPNLAVGSGVDWQSNIIIDKAVLNGVLEAVLKLNNRCCVFIAESDSISNSFAYLKF